MSFNPNLGHIFSDLTQLFNVGLTNGFFLSFFHFCYSKYIRTSDGLCFVKIRQNQHKSKPMVWFNFIYLTQTRQTEICVIGVSTDNFNLALRLKNLQNFNIQSFLDYLTAVSMMPSRPQLDMDIMYAYKIDLTLHFKNYNFLTSSDCFSSFKSYMITKWISYSQVKVNMVSFKCK